MRFTPASIALAIVLTTVSSVGLSQRPDAQIEPRSIEWQKAGAAAFVLDVVEAWMRARLR